MKIFGGKLTISAAIGIVIILVCAGSAALAPWVAPHDPNALMGQRWEGPSAQHWFGLDQLGRDMFSRMLYGGRISITLALLATLLAFAIGIVAGFAAALFGRWVDILLSRIADVILSIPILMSALIVISGFGTSATMLVLTIGLLYAVVVFRVARAVAMNIVVLEYVEAARLRGEGTWWIIRREILPNALPPMISEFGLRFCFNFLFVAALSFLGLGVQPPLADWGGMVKENAKALGVGGMAPLWPAAAIALMTIGVNLIVDWILSINARPSGASAEM
jgi:peptide/nickel transport system permease protein